MATTLDESNVEKKFRGVSQTQESIQSLSLWVIHHKAQHERIVDLWFQVLKKSKIPHRLTLLYLCNDIVQTCKKKHAIIYKDAFKEVLKDAVLLVRDNSIRSNVERIFKIWEERGVYDKGFLDELTAILNNTKVRAAVNSKLLAEFKPHDLVQLVLKVKKNDEEVEACSRQLVNVRVDSSNIEMIKQLKDRSQCKDYCQQFEDSCNKLQAYVDNLQKNIKDRVALVEMLEQSELFYDTQYGEAKIVANAYKNFGTRVNNLRRKLEEHMKTLPDPYSPVPSPSVDAPSPGNTPPQAHDILESMDMDLSDEEDMESESKEIKQIPGLGSPVHTNTGSTSHSLLQSGLGTDFMAQLEKDKNVISSTWIGTSTELAAPQSSSGNLVQLTEGGGTPVNDEGNSTPVQDEQPDSSRSCNPIEFLTQLISQSQSQKTPPTAASFLQNLTALTEKAKHSKVKTSEPTLSGDQVNPNTSSGEEYSQEMSSPSAPAWESWNTERETPSYVPDTRPTPALPFGEVSASAPGEQYSSGNQTQNLAYGTDMQQNSLYTSGQHLNNQTYTADATTAGQQPYDIESKPRDESFSSPPSQQSVPVLYGSDPQNAAQHSVDPQPPPPTQSYNTDVPYIQPDQHQQSPVGAPPVFSPGTVPPPPAVSGASNGSSELPRTQGQSQYTAQFYQEVPVSPSTGPGQLPQNSNASLPPGTPPVNMSEAPPVPFPPLPPTSLWDQAAFNAASRFSSAPSMYPPPPPPPAVNASASVAECTTPAYLSSGCTTSINSSGPKAMPTSFNASGSGLCDHPEFDQRNQASHQQDEGNQSHNVIRRNLAPVPMAGYDSPASTSNSDPDVEVLTIPTMVGKGRPNRPLHPPRQPSHPGRSGSMRTGQFSAEEDDQQEFIDKLKHKSYSGSVLVGPPKSTSKNPTPGMRNLRTLTDHEPDQCDGGMESNNVKDSHRDSMCGASEMDFEGVAGERHSRNDSEQHGHNRQWLDQPARPPERRPPPSGQFGIPFHVQRPNGPWSPFRHEPRYAPNRMPQPFDFIRDNHGRPFPKRHAPPFEFRHQRFPRY